MAIILCIFLFLSCASVPIHFIPEGRQIPEDFAGIVHAGKSGADTEFPQLNYLGAKWTLQTFYWHDIEPAQGEWDFSFYDKIVDDCNAAGIKIIALLAYDSPWIHGGDKWIRYVPPENLPDFLLYVRKTVEHFQGRVDAWCIWNEPNFYFWKGPKDEFIELSIQTADVIREIDKEGIILGGAFNRLLFSLQVGFIRDFFDSGAMEKVDYVAFHPYDTTVTRSIRLYEQFRKVVDEYGFGDKIWITEMGFPTGGVYPSRISLKRFPEAVIKVYAHLAYAGAMNVLWYQMYDPVEREYSGLRGSEDYFGLIRSAEDPTSKAAEAFRLCAAFMPNTICYALTPEQDGIPRSIQAFWFKGENNNALVLWNDCAGKKRLKIRLPGTNHILHDIVTGTEASIPALENSLHNAEYTVRAGSEPVFITWQGSQERPIITGN